jgi:ubiquinone/menaquinone biosynthesis C-methylase UbiE
MEQHSIEELNEISDNYFKQHAGNITHYLKKPFGNMAECPYSLVAFAEMLNGLKPLPGMRLLDFGAGTCWTSRYFADFKLDVIACDVSPTALEIGKQVFVRNPVVDSPFKPEFMVFNGRRLNLQDDSVDRIACIDTFHHIANPKAVLHELARVLKPGGIAGFSEPGPNHSKDPQSQYEMKNYKTIENDIILEEVWEWAKEAGFTDIQVTVFNSTPFSFSLEDFNSFLQKGSKQLKSYAEHVRRFLTDRRMFFLYKGERAVSDSRDRNGLASELSVELKDPRIGKNGWIEGQVVARNSGSGRWLPSDALFGPVRVGVHLKSSDGRLLNRDFTRVNLPPGRGVEPGETIEIPFRFRAPARSGDYTLEFDMVSEDVCWFEFNGAKVYACQITVE